MRGGEGKGKGGKGSGRKGKGTEGKGRGRGTEEWGGKRKWKEEEGDKRDISFVWVIGYCCHCIAALVLHYDEDLHQVLYVRLFLYINFMIGFRWCGFCVCLCSDRGSIQRALSS